MNWINSQQSISSQWQFYLRFFKGCGRSLLASTAGAVAAAGILLLVPMLVSHVFNEIIPQQRYGTLILIAILMLGIQGAYLGTSLWVQRKVLTISKVVTKALRREAVSKLYSLSDRAYTHLNRAGLHAKLIIDTGRVDRMTEELIGSLLPSLIVGAMLFCGMLYVSWQLFLVAVAVFLSLIPTIRWAGNRLSKLAQKNQRIVRNYSARLEFSISHIMLTRLKSAEDLELGIHDAMIEEVAQSERALAIWKNIFSELQNFFAFATAVVLLGVGVGATSAGWLTLGEMLAFYVLAMLFRGQYARFSQALTPVVEGIQALSTVQDVICFQDDLPYKGTKQIEFQGNIRFCNVGFGYTDDILIKDLSFELQPGHIVGIVGPNGTGKSTIIKLILGFYRPAFGQVLVDQQPLDTLDLHSYRRRIGVVMQDPMMFRGSVAENIGYGDPELRQDRIRAVARIATADKFVEDLSMGYDTPIGDAGVLLSGGQQQKISIARAIYNQPRLLILDEPTNHLDSRSVDTVLHNLSALPQKPSVLIISHDVRALSRADVLYRLETGRLFLESPQPLRIARAGDAT
ncbi:ABC transporter ATP-binding protein [Pseudomonadota bacterium]